MVKSFKSPLKAAKAVVQESYKLWLQYDVRTDDITMTVLYFEDMDGLEAAHKAAGRREGANDRRALPLPATACELSC